jgi:hypothetical protein
MEKVLRFRSPIAIFVVLAAGFPCAAADEKRQPLVPAPDRYFSGTVVSQTAELIIVSRTVLGRNQVSRSFILSPETVVEGELKERSRVTVQYVTREGTHEATHIIVRNPPPKR